MRYYSFEINTNSEKLREGAKIRLKDYNYENNIAAMNVYMSQNMKNDMTFFAYREENNSLSAVFSFNEKKYKLSDAYDHITDMLRTTFSVNKFGSEPHEITAYDFYDCMLEAKRRTLLSNWSRVIDTANLVYYHNWDINDRETPRFKLEEKIISDKAVNADTIFHKSVIKELDNIESHCNTSELAGNMVHYIISGKSTRAASDITEAIMQRLVKANRLGGKRMEIISEIDPSIYNGRNYLENIIENNFGGVIVIDMSEKFGSQTTEYSMACKYIERLVKRYKNNCLFVFTYNSDKPGFAYQLLPSVSKLMITVRLKEGSGDKRAAVKYLTELIKASEYSSYAHQASEFMQLFSGNKFSHTDVLTAFEKFEPWCLNRNVLHAYDYNTIDTFVIDRDEDTDSSYEKLQKLTGLVSVKEQIDNIIAADVVEKERKKLRGSEYQSGTMHMIFSGNPGTAKTTVAKLFAGIAKEKGILKSGAFVERGGMDLDSICCEYNIRSAFTEAEGGVLFIDEAYSLKSESAVTVLIQEMENRRDSVIVILAGYNDRMNDFMKLNEGLKSRIPYKIDFPDYSVDELTEIFKLMAQERGFEVTEGAVNRARHEFERVSCLDNFGNGRFVRNLLDQSVQSQAVRLLSSSGSAEEIPKSTLFLITEDDVHIPGEELKQSRAAGTARKELDDMIGLSSVKSILKKVIADYKLKKLCMDKGISTEKPSLHMCFTGNPGTAKTTVARLFAEIMKDERMLSSGVFVEAGRGDLVSDHVGGTARLVKAKFKAAQGGVLFIDEAYSLCDYHQNSFGDEAINTIVQEMENHRDDVIVIFAGYTNEMRSFLERNPGMASRVAFHVEFEDYTCDELCQITRLMLSRRGRRVTDAAMSKLRSIYKKALTDMSFGNGRFVRKLLEEAEMNLAERVSLLDDADITVDLLTTIEECDIPNPPEGKKPSEEKRVGFRCA